MVELRAESQSAPTRDLFLREAFDTLRLAFKYGTFAYLAYCGWQSITALAGKSTGADIGLAISAAIEIGREEWPPWAIAILMAVWAVTERRFRRMKTAMLATRIAELERRLDPLRESRQLPVSGKTREDDQP